MKHHPLSQLFNEPHFAPLHIISLVFLTVQKNKMPQLCTMCQTSHQMSDMVESKNDEGLLDFFCSNRCMTVHKSVQSVTAPGMMVTRFCTTQSEIIFICSSQPDGSLHTLSWLMVFVCLIEKKSPKFEEIDMEEMKPSLPNLESVSINV